MHTILYAVMVIASTVIGSQYYQLLRGLIIQKYARVKVLYKPQKGQFQVSSEAYFSKHQYLVIIFAPIIVSIILLLVFVLILPRAWF